jgi:hypothetical protein
MQHSGMSSVERDQQAHLCLGISEKEDGHNLETKARAKYRFSLFLMQDLAML